MIHGCESESNNFSDKYAVELVEVADISPSPENDDIYGQIEYDDQMKALIDSVDTLGLEEPIILTADNYILSGHRRFFAVKYLNWRYVPCRKKVNVHRSGNDRYHAMLSQYNPQRVKTVGSILKESLLRDTSPDDTFKAISEYNESHKEIEVDFMCVSGSKHVRDVSEKKKPFLKAVQKVIDSLRPYHPLSIRQIHYNLLNKPPLISKPKRSTKSKEHYRYRNDKASYKALIDLLKSARYHGHVAMNVIDDPTRPLRARTGWKSVSSFVNSEIEDFLCGYHRDKQLDQPRHIEVFCEKNTVFGMLRTLVYGYYTPLTAGRGFCSIPVWRDMARRFKKSGKNEMTLIIVSDYDPEGLELADDAIRSLRDLWNLPVEGHRVCVTREQINELELSEDFNPAKATSSQYSKFVEKTGDTKTWELEALPPDYLIETVKAAIEANMNMEIFNQVTEQEEEDADELFDIKQRIAGELQF